MPCTPRRLSDIEYVTFLSTVNVDAAGLPPWGGVIEWQGLMVLVYTSGTGERFLTDLSVCPDLVSVVTKQPREWNSWLGAFVYAIPKEGIGALIDAAQKGKALVLETAKTIGETAGNIVAPIVTPLSLPLVAIGAVAVIALILFYGPKRG